MTIPVARESKAILKAQFTTVDEKKDHHPEPVSTAAFILKLASPGITELFLVMRALLNAECGRNYGLVSQERNVTIQRGVFVGLTDRKPTNPLHPKTQTQWQSFGS